MIVTDPGIRDAVDRILIPEEGYADEMNNRVLPYLQARRTDGTLATQGEAYVHTVTFRADRTEGAAPKGTVLIVHGFTESTEKYRELSYYFLRFGYDVVAYDQRGHGRSYRKVSDYALTHIDRMDEYVDDLEAVVNALLPEAAQPLYLFAHSMGGAVSALYFERCPDTPVKKAVLSSPMIAPATGGFPAWLSKAVTGTCVLFGQREKRLFLSKPPEGREDFSVSANNSRPRFEFYQDMKVGAKEYSNNGPTYGWTLESLNVSKKILAKDGPEHIRTPLVCFSGETDNTVRTDLIAKFAARVPGAELCEISGCNHELYYSNNDFLPGYLAAVLSFYAQ